MPDNLNKNASRSLIYTKRGQEWLEQFDPLDQDAAISLTNSLTLISHNEFRRNLEKQIHDLVSKYAGPVALFAVREIENKEPNEGFNAEIPPFYSQTNESADGKSVSSVSASSDQGSEAIIAQIIRQICKANPDKLLNHPTLKVMRDTRCDACLFVDDFIGSGRRVHTFLDSFWNEPSVVSWLSSKHITFEVLAYSGTETGVKLVEGHKSRPEVTLHLDAPTIYTLPIGAARREAIWELCKKYGRVASKNGRYMWFGFQRTMGTMIFEHGCPNNSPAILWAWSEHWRGLFPKRTIDAQVSSVFPSEIARGDAVSLLRDIGQDRLARSGALLRRGETGQTVLIVLAMIAQGQRKRSSISYATGLSIAECERILAKCIKWKFVSPQRRITPSGKMELNAARKISFLGKPELDVGSPYYYPKQLRGAA